VEIRPERAEDFAEIDDVVRAAFANEHATGQDEVDIVRKIRTLPHCYVPELTLVMADAGEIVGHVMFSHSRISDSPVLQLAPLAVRPGRQNQKIGDKLTREGLRLADERGEPLCLVLGHPNYYPRFGFEPARPLGIEPEIEGLPDEVWMAVKLSAYDAEIRGTALFMPS
jgi:predicted N-acetyltransferase YhbS